MRLRKRDKQRILAAMIAEAARLRAKGIRDIYEAVHQLKLDMIEAYTLGLEITPAPRENETEEEGTK